MKLSLSRVLWGQADKQILLCTRPTMYFISILVFLEKVKKTIILPSFSSLILYFMALYIYFRYVKMTMKNVASSNNLALAFQYLILMILRPCDWSISTLASKCKDFKHRGLQFHFIKQLKNGHSNVKDLPFWRHWRYHDQI